MKRITVFTLYISSIALTMYGADADPISWRPSQEYLNKQLQRLIIRGKVSGVEGILDDGAKANSVDYTFGQYSPLHCAIIWLHPTIVTALIARGAGVNAQDALGLTPLHHLVDKDRRSYNTQILYALAKQLVSAGANVDCKDKNDQTPLERAEFLAQLPEQRDALSFSLLELLREEHDRKQQIKELKKLQRSSGLPMVPPRPHPPQRAHYLLGGHDFYLQLSLK